MGYLELSIFYESFSNQKQCLPDNVLEMYSFPTVFSKISIKEEECFFYQDLKKIINGILKKASKIFREVNIKVEICSNLKQSTDIVYLKEKYFASDNHKPRNDEDNTDAEELNSFDRILSEVTSWRNLAIRPPVISVFRADDDPRHPSHLGSIPWAWLNEEKWRLHTFCKYPQNAAKSAILLAADGFAYNGSGQGLDDSVICFFCRSVKNKWQPIDDISEVHRLLMPSCSMVTKINCSNIPLTTNLDNRIFENLLKSPISQKSHSRRGHNNVIEEDGIPVNNFDDQARELSYDAAPFVTSSEDHPIPSSSKVKQSSHQNQNNALSRSDSYSSPVSSSTTLSNSTEQNSFTQISASSVTPVVTTTPTSTTVSHSVPLTLTTSVTTTSTSARNSTTTASSTTPRSVASSSDSSVIAAPPPSAPAAEPSGAAGQSSAAVLTTTVTQTAAGNTVKGSASGPTYSELGIVTERPKRFEYALLPKRVETFGSWPRDHHLRPKELAEAGFYYAGYGDCARCFYCGGGLRNWEDEDDVWVEHARWFPKCAYIRQLMGQVFVDVVQDLNKTNDQISFKMVTDKIGTAASAFQLDSKDNPLKRDPAVKTVVDMGFPIKEVIAVAENIKEDGNILSADKIYEKLMDGDIKRSQTGAKRSGMDTDGANVTRDLEKLRNLKEQNNQLRQQTVCKICMDKEVAVVFLPCGHFVSCTDCAAAMKDCPVCRNHVKGIVRAFMG
ncbi:hypothetical protein Btru_052827 [Bulinus truncatus]|nr:hypothetical protein Btru_052827 [Bulinus truncatus]